MFQIGGCITLVYDLNNTNVVILKYQTLNFALYKMP